MILPTHRDALPTELPVQNVTVNIKKFTTELKDVYIFLKNQFNISAV